MISLKTDEEVTFQESKFITPGIHEVKITSITYVEGKDGKSSKLTFKWGDREGKTNEDSLFLSEKASFHTTLTLKHLVNAITGEDVKVEANTYDEFAKKLFSIIGNTFYRHVFRGEQIRSKDGSTWWKAKMGMIFTTKKEGKTVAINRIAESLDTNPTTLRFNPSSKFDMKPLVVPDEVTTNGVTVIDDLPF